MLLQEPRPPKVDNRQPSPPQPQAACTEVPGEANGQAAKGGEDKPRGKQGGRAGERPRGEGALTRKEAALVELVWGAASFTGDGCVPKVSAVPCSEEKRLTNCVLQGSKGEVTRNQERGTRSREVSRPDKEGAETPSPSTKIIGPEMMTMKLMYVE
jgi:hypothetical protein